MSDQPDNELSLDLQFLPDWAQDDVGKVIGRRGRTVRAMRTLVKAAAARTGQKVEFEVVD